MTPEPPGSGGEPHPRPPLAVEQLTESYRFDAELAELLTAFQYRADGLSLTAAEERPLPATAYTTPTPGLEAVFDTDASLVFVCYGDRRHRMVNPIETRLVTACVEAVQAASGPSASQPDAPPATDGGRSQPLGEGPADGPSTPRTSEPTPTAGQAATGAPPSSVTQPVDRGLTMGVVTPHNAQRGHLQAALPAGVTANTVEKYQGGERDIIAVSATVSDPTFARSEERFILNPRRLLVAISRSKRLTIVVCSTALFEVAPADSERLAEGPLWARLFTLTAGPDPEPAWDGSVGTFIGDDSVESASVPVGVYPSTVSSTRGESS